MKNPRNTLYGRASFWGKEAIFIAATLLVVGSCMPERIHTTPDPFPTPVQERREEAIVKILPPEKPETICLRSNSCKKLAEVGYFEARSESDSGVLATMFVVLNRVSHSAYPNTIHEVVHQPYQFSYTHDGSLSRGIKEPEQYKRTLRLAYKVLTNKVESVVGEATHYHTTAIRPYWSKSLNYYATIGNHRFYTY